jgi:hypothetical protein
MDVREGLSALQVGYHLPHSRGGYGVASVASEGQDVDGSGEFAFQHREGCHVASHLHHDLTAIQQRMSQLAV